MNINTLVIDTLGKDSFNKGLSIPRRMIKYYDSFDRGHHDLVHIFQVHSQKYYYYYDVNYIIRDNNIVSYFCECKQFKNNNTCKHLAAVLLNFHDIMFKPYPTLSEVSNEILQSFKNDHKLKEEVNLDIELDFTTKPRFKLYIGTSNMYVLNTEVKFIDFRTSFLGNEEFYLGAKFTFDPSLHYFNDYNKQLLDFLFDFDLESSNIFELSDRELNILLEMIKDRRFKIKNHGVVNGVKYELPTPLSLELVDSSYKLSIDNYDSYLFLDRSNKYILYNCYLYVIPPTYYNFISKLQDNSFSELVFDRKLLPVFKDGLLQKIKNNIKICEGVEDVIITDDPTVSMYFDIYNDYVCCDLKFDYSNHIVNYFDNDSVVVRDKTYENNVLNDLSNYKFISKNNKFVLVDIDDIGNFFENGLNKLCEKYDVFTSKKIEKVSIFKKNSIKSNFSIGMDGILSYSFESGEIDLDEVGNILSSLKKNKHYYKLKSGNIIDLFENNDIKELGSLVNDLDLSINDVDTNIVIPKYKALYINSLKNNKYNSIVTDNSFDKFIENFQKYKNSDIVFNEFDNNILRDYQKEGVKWLYTLYKCDLGGILADEMGLGKSIQVICFLKQILSVKKDAKILIVCPTSLVYNWKKEFDKFGSELKYITVYNNKKKRSEIIKNMDDYNIFITSYGLIRNDNDEYENIDFELCVIDEAQAIKNYQSMMSQEIKKIKARTKIALTGTPLENSVLELWSIFDFIMPGYLNNIHKFKEVYGISDVDDESLNRLENLNYQIKPFILRRKKDEVSKDLPDKIVNDIYLDFDDNQKKLYMSLVKESEKDFNDLVTTHGFNKARFKILQLLMKLRQVCVDPNILYNNYKGTSVKMEKLLEIVNSYISEGHKILIFSSFKTVINKVNKLFEEKGISAYIINGDVKGADRINLVDKFNNDDTNCFLITLKSGGTGLNLTSADIVIHLDVWWNPQVENQATDRAHRIGQDKNVSVIRFITRGTIEEKIIELQEKKKILSDNLLEGKNNSSVLSGLDEKDIELLLSYSDND